MIRAAVEADIPRMVEMGLRFHRESSYKDHVTANQEQMSILGHRLLRENGLIVSERQGEIVGMLGFFVFPHFLSGEMVAGEVFWWVEPEHRGEGVKLLREMEKQAREAGAKSMQMIAPTAEVASFYLLDGYSFVEAAFQKSL